MPLGGLPDDFTLPGYAPSDYGADPSLGTNVRMPDGSYQNFAAGTTPIVNAGNGTAFGLPTSDAYKWYADQKKNNQTHFLESAAALIGGPLIAGALSGAGAAGASTAGYTAPGASIVGSSVPAAGGGTAWLTGAGGVGGLSGAGSAAAGAGGSGMGLGLTDWLSLGSNLLGGVLGSKAANKAANAQITGDQAAIDELRRQFDVTRADQAPYQQAGVNALGKLQDPAANFATSPGYQFRLQQGMNNLGNSFAARGGAFSGNALKALSDYNQGQATNEYGNWWNQQAGLAGVGQTATNATGLLGQNASGNVAGLTSQQGNSRSSGILGSYGSIYGGLNDALQSWLYRRGNQGP